MSGRGLTALVLGDAACVHKDAKAALELFTPDVICATNNIGRDWLGHVDFWCTLHPFRCPDWPGIEAALEARIAAGRNRPEIWAHKKLTPSIYGAADHRKGSTGLLCVEVVRLKGCERIVLAGVPMSREGGHYYDDRPWVQFSHFTQAWALRRDELAPYVRSMSGYTKELFGPPTLEWLGFESCPQADASRRTGAEASL